MKYAAINTFDLMPFFVDSRLQVLNFRSVAVDRVTFARVGAPEVNNGPCVQHYRQRVL